MEIYHQLGHNFHWNIQSIQEDHTGVGAILAPRSISKLKLSNIPADLMARSFFDPQFFVPAAPVGKLSEYDFFPSVVTDGFDSSDYMDGAVESAMKCVQFQTQWNFKNIVIPTRYASGMPTSFISSQTELFVTPFLTAVQNCGIQKPVVLQLIVNDDMIKDDEYSADLLNWITGIPNVQGVYLIAQVNKRRKQVDDIDFLFAYLKFVDALSNNEMPVCLGYLNLEAFLLSLANPAAVTLGSYENTRAFNIGNYEKKEKKSAQGPNARIYTSRLLQWVDYRYRTSILEAYDNDVSVFDENKYQILMFEPSYNWHFTKPEPYLHHFLVFSNQLKGLSNHGAQARYESVVSKIQDAIAAHEYLDSMGVALDPESGGKHLYSWLTAANRFANYKHWAE